MNVKVACYLDVVSSWCYWAEPAWAELKRRYATAPVEFARAIALLDERNARRPSWKATAVTGRSCLDWSRGSGGGRDRRDAGGRGGLCFPCGAFRNAAAQLKT